MYMPLMVDIRRAVVFGGERGEGLQKTQKLALFADDLLVVAESLAGAESLTRLEDSDRYVINLPRGPQSMLNEKLHLPGPRAIAVHELDAARLAKSGGLQKLIAGASFVCSDLKDMTINSEIARIAAEHHVLCNIIDTKPLCTTWFMSLIETEHLLAAFSTKGQAAYYAARIREELQDEFESRDRVADLLIRLRNLLPRGNAMQGLDAVYRDSAFQKALQTSVEAAQKIAHTILSKEGLM